MQKLFIYEEAANAACDYLKDNLNYRYVTLRHYRSRWLVISNFMKEKGLSILNVKVCSMYLSDFYHGRAHHQLSTNEKFIEKAVFVLQEFVETGKIVPKQKVRYFDGEIGACMKKFLQIKEYRNLKSNTLDKIESHLSSFDIFLIGRNIQSMSEINPRDIIDYIRTLNSNHPAKIHDTLTDLRQFFDYAYTQELIDTNIARYVPKDHYVRDSKLPSYYTEMEIVKLLGSVDRGSEVGKRDYAILLLAVKLGLRASDIAFLKFDNLNWESCTIHVSQYKTGKSITFPLLANIGNAILDYIQYSRVKSSEQYVFLLALSPHLPMRSQAISSMVQRYFSKAGLSDEKRRHGCHALRHSLVKELLNKQLPLPVITEVLGHKNIESTKHYIRINEEHLRMCSLDVPPVTGTFYEQKGGVFR
jgi:site-specific recombinase XerD